jgi:uncharacterized protein YjbJ (UPF0337 family)
MGIGNKARREGQDLVGKAKQLVGRARRDRPLEMEGKREQNKADLKKAGEHIRRAFKR